jgi:hypothetical protein
MRTFSPVYAVLGTAKGRMSAQSDDFVTQRPAT